MKLIKTAHVRFLIAITWLAGLGLSAPAAVTFTNTPSVVSNTYTGLITLQIGGLTNTETVVIQKFLDLNNNGILDGSDMLVQQFNLTDGTNFVIGSVTNFNVPGDLNSSMGAITAQLNFQNGDFVQNIVGNYLYILSSPGGHFAPITNSFTVTNFPFAQKFTGNVVSNSTSTTLSNAVVLLFPPPRSGKNGPGGNPLAGVVANNAGAYTVMAPAGTYALLAFETNYVGNFNKAPVLTLGSGQTINTNLSLTNATASITGQVVDAANNAIGLPGVFMGTTSTNGLIAISTTDTNGNFNLRVTASEWGIGGDDTGLIVHGYVGWNGKTNVNSGTTGLIVAYPKANALFYGSVKDSLGNPLVGIDVNAYDTSSYLYAVDGYTDANGNYFVGALGLGSSDPWQVGISGRDSLANYIFSQPAFDQNNGTNLAVGQAVLQNFTGILATNLITGNVQANGTNIAVVGVMASAIISSVNYFQYVDTDASGNYSLNVANGTWSISVNCNGGNDSLDNKLGIGTYQCPNNQTAIINNNNATNNFIVQLCSGISFITPSPLPVGEVNAFYNQTIQASDCSGTYNWLQTVGTLPGNLNLYPGGQFYTLSGFPTNSGNFGFTVQVNDGGSNTTNQQYSVSISNALQVTTTSLPDATNGMAYSQNLQASYGVPFAGVPYSWSLASGSLPGNLNLATNGLLSGTLATSGLFNFTVAAADSLGVVFNQPLALNIVSTNISVAPPVSIASAGGQMVIYYPSSGLNYVLQTATNLAGPWLPATNGISVVALTFTNTAPVQFFRLH